MKAMLSLLLAIGLASTSLGQQTVLVDDFDDGLLDPMWTLTLENATAWSYTESADPAGTLLEVTDVQPINSGSSCFVKLDSALSQPVNQQFNFEIDGIELENASGDRGTTNFVLLDEQGGGIVAFSAQYDNRWFANIGGTFFFGGADSFPSGSDVRIIRDATNLVTVTMNGHILASEMAPGSVGTVRFFYNNSAHTSCPDFAVDRIQLTDLNPPLSLSASALVSGSPGSLTTSYGTPMGMVGFAYSVSGAGNTSVNAGACGTITAGILNPVVLGLVQADGNGTAIFAGDVPPGLSGLNIWFQALDLSSCELTNVVATQIQ
ncbi:MAG: hypothetical protein DWQ01_00105 [Planctomycetota bacterium]|nr:MAG: hypothetical protein DWQ01_00105 [Planctomycetota bacterium]